jgi:hypothetical protein
VPLESIVARDHSLRAANPEKKTDYEFPSADVLIVGIRLRQDNAAQLAKSLEAVFAVASREDGSDIPDLDRLPTINGEGGLDGIKQSLVFGRSRAERDWLPVGDCVDWIADTEAVRSDCIYRFAGVKSFGRGGFVSGEKVAGEFQYKQLRRLQFRDFFYPKLMAWEGAFAMVPRELDGCVVSPEFVLFRAREHLLLPEVLDTYFRCAICLDDVQGASRGSNKRRRRLNPKDFLCLKIPMPPKREQLLLRRVYEFEAALKMIEGGVLTAGDGEALPRGARNRKSTRRATKE